FFIREDFSGPGLLVVQKRKLVVVELDSKLPQISIQQIDSEIPQQLLPLRRASILLQRQADGQVAVAGFLDFQTYAEKRKKLLGLFEGGLRSYQGENELVPLDRIEVCR